MKDVIQKVVAWRYPCESEMFYFKGRGGMLHLLSGNEPCDSYSRLKSQMDECGCGKNCKPEKIEIVVRRV